MQTNIEAYSKDLQESMENIVVEYNNKYQEFNKNFSTMSDAVRQLKEKELNDLIQRRNDFEQVAQQDLQKRYNELLAPIIDKAKAAIDKVATAGSYLAVFDTSTGSLAYFDEAMLTDLAPAELDKMRQSVKPVIEKFSVNIGPDFVKGFYAEVDKVRKSAK